MGLYRKALVLGLGASGEAATLLLLREGTKVTVVDESVDGAELTRRIRKIQGEGVVFLHQIPESGEFDVCVVSPGLDSASELVRKVELLGIPVISELELGFLRCCCPIVAITGTNGKSTAVKLCHEALSLAGFNSAIAGNYGIPVCAVVNECPDLDWLVVEVSSFQLEKTNVFKPEVAVLLNIQPDHLDRHVDMDAYIALKCRIFAQMDENGVGIVPEDIAVDICNRAKGKNRWLRFGTGKDADYRFANGCIEYTKNNKKEDFSLNETIFDNSILGVNTAAVAAAVSACGCSASFAGKAALGFECLPHRMEHFAVINGVHFVDDSKATNLSAMLASIKAVNGRVLLVAGGLLKEKKCNFVKEMLASKVKGVYLIGDAAKALRIAWSDVAKCTLFRDLSSAVNTAWKDACRGDTVLLAPGCASFDQFNGYDDRGNKFKAIVEVINEKESV